MAELMGETVTARGKVVLLPEGREVFVGRVDLDDKVYLRFRNRTGEETRLKLSSDAAAALTQLLLHRDDGAEPEWREGKP